MAEKKSQTKSQRVHQNNDPDETLRNLSESDIDELIQFFQMLDEWDRQNTANALA